MAKMRVQITRTRSYFDRVRVTVQTKKKFHASNSGLKYFR